VMRIGAIDHRALFPRASVVVHHGGAGTTHAVAAAGVPSVVVPHIGDQRYWGERLSRLGVAPPALRVDRLTAGALSDAVLAAAADREMRTRASRLAATIHEERGLETAAEALEVIASG
jgi:sterol 3beta-glucosyltransferase